jgi:small subunit ribosomal protein S9
MAEDERREPDQEQAKPGAGEPIEGPPAEPAEQPDEAAAEQPGEAAAEQPDGAAAEQPAADSGEPAEAPEDTEKLSEEAAAELEPSAEEAASERAEEAGDALEEAAERERRPRGKASERGERGLKEGRPADVIPGEHLEPDLVLEPEAAEEEFAYPATADEGEAVSAPPEAPSAATEEPLAEAAPAARTPLDLAADARYQATGKRKTSVARVIVKPGSGAYVINGKTLEEYFPRPTLRRTARQPLETAGYETRMDVVAKIHGGGVSAQAGALRHGVARALVEADPNLRTELKRRGFLTRDARAKERKKAGLKKARKRPQFSKR